MKDLEQKFISLKSEKEKTFEYLNERNINYEILIKKYEDLLFIQFENINKFIKFISKKLNLCKDINENNLDSKNNDINNNNDKDSVNDFGIFSQQESQNLNSNEKNTKEKNKNINKFNRNEEKKILTFSKKIEHKILKYKKNNNKQENEGKSLIQNCFEEFEFKRILKIKNYKNNINESYLRKTYSQNDVSRYEILNENKLVNQSINLGGKNNDYGKRFAN